MGDLFLESFINIVGVLIGHQVIVKDEEQDEADGQTNTYVEHTGTSGKIGGVFRPSSSGVVRNAV
jgi:hypothetical protein